jgi:hypothetical protein
MLIVDAWQKRTSVACDIMEQHKVQHCNNHNDHNDDILMHANVWHSLMIYFDVKTHDGGKHDNEERDLN